MDKSQKAYFIKVQNLLIEVSREIYIEYYTMERKERYLTERDRAHGLIYYDEWSTETTNGIDNIRDTNVNVEEEALEKSMPDIWSYVDQIEDKYNICRLIAAGKNETEIAQIFGITQQAVSKTKYKLFRRLKEIIEKEF